MADKSKFKFAAFLSMGLLFSIYFPTAASGYLSLGDCVEENVINGLSDGALKKADHLISIRMNMYYSIVKDSSADLGVIFRIVKNFLNLGVVNFLVIAKLFTIARLFNILE